ncbi:SagB/ThcOx family dehydrogenase [Oceanobacter sp. 4_MG-2023]|uniref:SagB/ThcOx family dehydrogenase n=1 Tax=Oceanobacter sp. 4_MG-2023 TaxID=3062623 RepID=UPI0027348418|nr:SagB/ThcOx family dehydrogenase [Oceanobacter sp. 4_MG-2023]MDP2547493.1 SagB/ThcOx family dehydrogenase [Oceanobacter sp. 4_MG-2023]
MPIREYHQRTRHLPDAYAAGPESLDWDAQPNPFRRYDGARLVPLPLGATDLMARPDARRWEQLWQPSVGQSSEAVVIPDLGQLGLLLELSLALSAWKQFGNAKWSLRVNPSSGNLHPTECYLLVRSMAGLEDGVYHYRPDQHALELRCPLGLEEESPEPLLYLGLSSVHWREAWKYGERAYRYCQLDVGHALAAVSFAASTLGWHQHQIRPVALADSTLASLLGLDRPQDLQQADGSMAEAEHPDCLLNLLANRHPDSASAEEAEQITAWLGQQKEWMGRANVLDPRHMYQWPVIDEVAAAARIPATSPASATTRLAAADWPAPAIASGSEARQPAARLIRQRRSAQAFDAAGGMALADFYTLLDHCLPRSDYSPWHTLPLSHGIQLMLFVHKVEGLPSGLYCLQRDTGRSLTDMQASLRAEFQWQPVESAPEHLPFYRLLAAGTRRTAMRLSCQQAIAGESAFSLAMLADCDGMEAEPWRYRHLYWQAGAIGQVLYLEAEAAGLRGTGIGCYYDDMVHNLLGLQNDQQQVLYHFTVGVPVIDHRITSWSAYGKASVEPSPPTGV